MALTTLLDLKESIADWLNRDDLDAVIPDFIKMAQTRINKDVRSYIDGYEYSATLTDVEQVNPITGISVQQVETLVIDGRVVPLATYEKYVSEVQLSTISGGVWTVIDGQVHYSGFPSDAGAADVEIQALGHRSMDIDFADDTYSIVGEVVDEDIILYASLVDASIYLRDMEGVQIYQPRYDELIDKLIKQYKRERVAGGYAVSAVGGDK